jgi:uracil phosphoribosyltransferase
MIHNFSKKHSVVNHFIAELRNVHVQKDRMRFRTNLRRLAACMAYEISKLLDYEESEIETPLGIATIPLGNDRIVVGSIMRAGLPMHEGVLDIFDQADNAFIGAYRMHHKDGSFEINHEYTSSANLQDAILILCDPMLATGASIRIAIDELNKNGDPKAIHIVTAIASTTAIEFVSRMFPKAHIWAGAIDDELTAKGYIVPGLGDAGDLAFGEKS